MWKLYEWRWYKNYYLYDGIIMKICFEFSMALQVFVEKMLSYKYDVCDTFNYMEKLSGYLWGCEKAWGYVVGIFICTKWVFVYNLTNTLNIAWGTVQIFLI